MISPTCSVPRNIHFYDRDHPEVVLGGFYQNGSITEANFLAILEILRVADGKPVRVEARASGYIVLGNSQSLATGDYDISCDDMYCR